MSRSEVSLLLASSPTASQVMIGEIANGIVETKNLHVCAVWCKWLPLGASGGRRVWHSHLVALQWFSWMAFQSWSYGFYPRRPVWPAAFSCEFAQSALSGAIQETRRLQSTVAMDWREDKLGRNERRSA